MSVPLQVIESEYRTMEESSRKCAHNFCLESTFCALKYVEIGNTGLVRVLEYVDITST